MNTQYYSNNGVRIPARYVTRVEIIDNACGHRILLMFY